MVKTIDEIIKEANDPKAMAAFVNLALGTPLKKKVKKFVTTIDPETGRKRRTQTEEVVTEQEGKQDKQALFKLLEMTGDIANIDVELKAKKLNALELEENEEQELYDEAEDLL